MFGFGAALVLTGCPEMMDAGQPAKRGGMTPAPQVCAGKPVTSSGGGVFPSSLVESYFSMEERETLQPRQRATPCRAHYGSPAAS